MSSSLSEAAIGPVSTVKDYLSYTKDTCSCTLRNLRNHLQSCWASHVRGLQSRTVNFVIYIYHAKIIYYYYYYL